MGVKLRIGIWVYDARFNDVEYLEGTVAQVGTIAVRYLPVHSVANGSSAWSLSNSLSLCLSDLHGLLRAQPSSESGFLSCPGLSRPIEQGYAPLLRQIGS